MIEDLKKSITELEFHLAHLRDKHGAALYEAQNTDGSYIAAPILAALVNGKAALLNRGVL